MNSVKIIALLSTVALANASYKYYELQDANGDRFTIQVADADLTEAIDAGLANGDSVTVQGTKTAGEEGYNPNYDFHLTEIELGSDVSVTTCNFPFADVGEYIDDGAHFCPSAPVTREVSCIDACADRCACPRQISAGGDDEVHADTEDTVTADTEDTVTATGGDDELSHSAIDDAEASVEAIVDLDASTSALSSQISSLRDAESSLLSACDVSATGTDNSSDCRSEVRRIVSEAIDQVKSAKRRSTEDSDQTEDGDETGNPAADLSFDPELSDIDGSNIDGSNLTGGELTGGELTGELGSLEVTGGEVTGAELTNGLGSIDVDLSDVDGDNLTGEGELTGGELTGELGSAEITGAEVTGDVELTI